MNHRNENEFADVVDHMLSNADDNVESFDMLVSMLDVIARRIGDVDVITMPSRAREQVRATKDDVTKAAERMRDVGAILRRTYGDAPSFPVR